MESHEVISKSSIQKSGGKILTRESILSIPKEQEFLQKFFSNNEFCILF